MVTMRDVARIANVSSTTVSHVINDTRYVDPTTRAAVLAAIEDTGYTGNSAARFLRQGRTYTLGLAMSAISNPLFGDVVSSIERHATENGYSILLADTHDDPERELSTVLHLISYGVDAVVLAPSAEPGPSLAQLTRAKVPVVLIDRIPDVASDGIDAIGVVNDDGMAVLTTHLADLGHTRIGLISSIGGLATTEERSRGYERGLREAGLPPDAELIGHTNSEIEEVDAEVSRLLALPDPPTALLLGNNRVAINALHSLKRRSIRVPEDLAVAAFDDFELADLLRPTLTTIRQPIGDIGRGAVDLVLRRIADRDAAPEHRRLPGILMHRESCGDPS